MLCEKCKKEMDETKEPVSIINIKTRSAGKYINKDLYFHPDCYDSNYLDELVNKLSKAGK